MTANMKRAAWLGIAAFGISIVSLALVLSGPAWAQDSAPPQAASEPPAPAAATSPSVAAEPATPAQPPAVADRPVEGPTISPATSPAAPASSAEANAPPQANAAPAPVASPAAAAAGPAAEPAAAANPLIGIDPSELPRNLSPWGMFMQADIVVKAVMIGLAVASILTWTIWLAKSLELAIARRKLRRAYRAINGAISLAEAAQRLGRGRGIVRGYIEQATLELGLSKDVADKAGISERVGSRVSGLATAAGRAMNRGTGALATIGSTAPFVGLFGTVWGIMNSFIGISEAQTTNLAVVAPGIAEALLATAIGLVAAIPAVIIYNNFSRSISAYKAALNDAADEVMRIVSRDLDRGVRAVLAEAAE